MGAARIPRLLPPVRQRVAAPQKPEKAGPAAGKSTMQYRIGLQAQQTRCGLPNITKQSVFESLSLSLQVFSAIWFAALIPSALGLPRRMSTAMSGDQISARNPLNPPSLLVTSYLG